MRTPVTNGLLPVEGPFPAQFQNDRIQILLPEIEPELAFLRTM